MPTITLNKKVFEELVGKKLKLDKLKDRISMLGTDLERIEGNEIVVEVFPNRPDMLSEQGFARAFSSFIGVKTGLARFDVEKSGEKVVIDKSVKGIRPYTACAIIKDIHFDNEKIIEIIQMQEKLHVTFGRHRKKAAIGIYPMEKIRFPITFKAMRPEDIRFRPLESDDVMSGKQILSKHPTGREYGHLLDGMKRYPVFVDADDEILSMPPIVNSHTTGKITENTTDVFVECSGHDLNTLQKCLNMVVTAMSDMGGKIYSLDLEYPDEIITTPDLEPEKWDLDVGYINKRLGLELSEKEIIDYLGKMGHGFADGKILVPAYRADIMHMVDFVEDVAIAYGYENFDAEMPDCATIARQDDYEIFKTKIADIMVSLGFIETNTYNITNADAQTSMMNCTVPLVRLKNALSEDYDTLRAWVIPSQLEVLRNNKHNEYPQNIFTIGRVFSKGRTETGVLEADRLAVLLCHENADFTGAKQVLDYIFSNIGIEYNVDAAEHGSFIPGRTGRVFVNNKGVAYIGEIHPKVLENWDMKFPVSAIELNLTDLFDAAGF